MNSKLPGIAILIEGIIWTLRKIRQYFNLEVMKLAVPSHGPDQPILTIQFTDEPRTILRVSEEAAKLLATESPSLFGQNQIRNREGPRDFP